MYNPWSGYRMTGTWQDHLSYSLGGEDYPLAYGTALAAPASGTLRTSGGSGEFAAGWIGSAGRRSILMLDTPVSDLVAIVFQHQSSFGTAGWYKQGSTIGKSGASANGKDWGGDVHLHVHGLRANGTRVQFTKYVGTSTAGGGGVIVANFSTDTQTKLQRIGQGYGYTGPLDGKLGVNSWIAIQKWLTFSKFYTGPADGVPGINTYKGLQKVAALGGYTGPIDGILGPNSEAGLNKWLTAKLAPVTPPKPPVVVPPPVVKVFPEGETDFTGVDVGSSQKDFDFAAFFAKGGDFAILKMGGANASDSPYVAPYYLSQLSRARLVAGLLVGHYWMNGNKNGLTPAKSAQFFAQNISAKDGDIFALDIEAIDGVPAYTPAEALEFIAEFRKTFPGALFLIYLNRALLDQYDWEPLETEGHRLWVATLDGTRDPDTREFEDAAVVQFIIGKTAGSTVDVDLNIAKTNLATLRYKRPVVIPPESDKIQEMIAELKAIIAKYEGTPA